jgi:glucosamine kinase
MTTSSTRNRSWALTPGAVGGGHLRSDTLLLGVDGGGTKCRARLCAPSGAKLGEAEAGPANIRLGLDVSFAAVLQATQACLTHAGLSSGDLSRITAWLALAGASEPTDLDAARRLKYPFARAMITSDAHAACVGAHGGRDGGVVVVGTGTIGWAQLKGRQYRVGGWGAIVGDEGSGAWIGRELMRRVLWAHDGRIQSTPLLDRAFEQFQSDPHAIVRWASDASPHEFGAVAPLVVEHAQAGDAIGVELMRGAASHIDALAARLVALGVDRIALVGGLSDHVGSWVSDATQARLTQPAGDALDGALELARATAESVAA